MSEPQSRNIKLLLEYDGTEYVGWQRQHTGVSIQSKLEEVVEAVAGYRIPVLGSGRTDSGVHALGQVAHFQSPPHIEPTRWRSIFNDHLPPDIRVLASEEAPPGFHSLNDSVGKIYCYRVLNRSYSSALDRRVYFFPRPLNWERIREALPHFIGERDFKAFQGAKSTTKTSVRHLRRFELRELGNGLYEFELEGSGFLKQMVRNIMGTVLEVGLEKREVADIKSILESRDRRRAGRTAPASGLCLVRVLYH